MPHPTLHIHYCHGLESGPNGFKVTQLRTWARVTSPDQHMSQWSPLKRNSFLRSLLRHLPARPRLHRAILDSLDACVRLQARALDGPDVLVGSSWGGWVAACLISEGIWTGPAVLLCPALHLMERRLPTLSTGPRSAEALTQALAGLPQSSRQRICLVHGTADTVVPLSDSQALASRAGLRLETIPEGSHGLGTIATDGRLRDIVSSVVSGAPPRK